MGLGIRQLAAGASFGGFAAKVRAYMRQILAPNLFRAEAICFRTRQSGHATWIAGYILGGTELPPAISSETIARAVQPNIAMSLRAS